ncbi:MAG: Ni/Fe-hydrogenase, b-type cytochrome subunit [Saprospiraceae bacterium]
MATAGEGIPLTLAFSITFLIISGFLIANPPAIESNLKQLSVSFGFVRTLHFVFAYLLMAVLLFRIYWAFVGNRFAEWQNFIPYTKKGLLNIWYVLKVDIFLMKDKDHKLSNISIGHNYLAAFSYFILLLLILFQIFTGFGLMADTGTWWLPKMFAFVKSFFGGEVGMRYWHHIFTWVFMAFVVIHVYLVLYHDYIEARGEASAMISGYKYVRAERIKKSEKEIIEAAREQMWTGSNKKENSENVNEK